MSRASTEVNITPESLAAASKRGRKALPSAEQVGPDFIGHTHPEDAIPQAIMDNAVDSYTEDRDQMNQLWGQIQMAGAISKLTTVVGLQKLAHIKEAKLYKALRGKKGVDKDGDEIPDVGTWDGFCRSLGQSANKVDEDLMNLAVFGEEALAQLTAVGAGYRELRKLRKLPEDERLAIARAPDKESLLELIDDLAAKHATEKAKLEDDLKEASETLEIRDRQIKAKDAKINELDAALAKPAPEYAQAAALEALDHETNAVVAAVMAGMRRAVLDVLGDGTVYDLDRAARQQIGAAMGRIVLAVRDVSADLDLDINESTKQDTDSDDDIWAAVNAEMAAKAAGGNAANA